MNSPRSLRSPRRAAPQSPKVMINIYKVDVPDMQPKRIKKPKSIEELLKMSREMLDLNRPPKRVLDEEGNTIKSLKDLPHDSNVYISCVDEPKEEPEEITYKSRLPNTRRGLEIPLKVKTPKEDAKRPSKPEDAVQHQAIAASPGTVKENLRDSLLALYSSMDENQKSQLTASPALSKLLTETRQFEIEDTMLSSFIGPSSVIAGTEEGEAARSRMLEELKGLKAEDCQFCITGPIQSGKSTLLFLLVSLFFEKLELAGEGGDYLGVVINWLQEQIYLEDISKIYNLFVEATMRGLRRCRKELIPIIPVLESWFKSLITIPTRAPLPPQAVHFRGFPDAAFTKLGEDIWKAWKGRNKVPDSLERSERVGGLQKGLKTFLNLAASLPANVASVLGLKGAVLVYDHIEAAAILISENSGDFTEIQAKPIALSDIISETLRAGPCFIASQSDADFFHAYDVDDLKQITTERLMPTGERGLMIAEPQMELGEDICKGCPGYVAKFRKLCSMVEEMTEKTAIKSQFAKLRSVVDIARKEMVKQELRRLCLLLTNDNDDSIDSDKMNFLMQVQDINIKLR